MSGPTHPIRCVAFDAVGTLIYPEPSVSKVYWEVARQYGSQLSLDEVRTRFYQAFDDLSKGARGDYSTSESEEKDRWREIVSRVLPDVNDPNGCFETLHHHFGQASAWRAFPDVAETLAGLVDRGIDVLVASNFDERLHPVCDELPELRPRRKRVISASIGWHKPSPQFYTRLIEIAGVPAGQILMVGDGMKNDITSARACGLSAILIDRNTVEQSESISDLRHLLSRVLPCGRC